MRKPLILFLLLSFSVAYGKDKISIAYFEAEPHIIYNYSTREISGALYDFLNNYIAPEMGVEFIWHRSPSNFPRQLYLLSNESVDTLAILVHTEDRARKFSFTKNAYYFSKPVIGVLKKNTLKKIEKVEDIIHLKIGYAAKTYISPFMRDRRINFEFVSSYSANKSNFFKLNAGRVDAIYIPDKAALLHMTNTMKTGSMIRILEIPEEPIKLHVVFSKKNIYITKIFDRAFEKINGEKIYKELISKYLKIRHIKYE